MTAIDLIKGNGPRKNYGKTFLNGDAIYWNYQEKTTTTLSPEGKPIISYEGEVTFSRLSSHQFFMSCE